MKKKFMVTVLLVLCTMLLFGCSTSTTSKQSTEDQLKTAESNYKATTSAIKSKYHWWQKLPIASGFSGYSKDMKTAKTSYSETKKSIMDSATQSGTSAESTKSSSTKVILILVGVSALCFLLTFLYRVLVIRCGTGHISKAIRTSAPPVVQSYSGPTSQIPRDML